MCYLCSNFHSQGASEKMELHRTYRGERPLPAGDMVSTDLVLPSSITVAFD